MMERREALNGYYQMHNEDVRLTSKHGAVDEMDDKTFELYMKYHLCICERPDMVGATSHMLDVFRKE